MIRFPLFPAALCVSKKSAGELQNGRKTNKNENVCKSLQKMVENLHNPFRKEVKLEMRYQRKPEPEEKTINPIPVRIPVSHLQEPSHSSQRALFRYSDIEADPTSYELNFDSAYVEETFTMGTELPSEISQTMEDHFTYLRSVQKHSSSTDILKLEKKNKSETKKQKQLIMRLQTLLRKINTP